ncbi:hypothetical protein RclHR1_04490001 [Rhizophagus clarus]|uniref:Uncharacterized protein n=1 Tax=Rhizophagus clarus TaxID=94130 RepID=A0A2Z6RV41_9GLOM|nr:hypothetical protein RclHR1_04490001 [Rhizophagus clarus]GES95372.1 hypothetical protein GLOIN_2v1669333 [Rhizophagus clarus]
MTRTTTSLNSNKYFEKIRGSNCSRVQRIKLSKAFNASPYERIVKTNRNNNHPKDCNSCNDSGNCMKLLTERLARIEDLVNNLYKITQGLKNSKKNHVHIDNNNSKKKVQMFRNIDLSTCKLDDLQKLVIFATNSMSYPSSQTSISPKFINNNEKILTEDYLKNKYFATNWKEEKLKCSATLDLKPSDTSISKIHVSTVCARDQEVAH